MRPIHVNAAGRNVPAMNKKEMKRSVFLRVVFFKQAHVKDSNTQTDAKK